jgi:hypothetical protein
MASTANDSDVILVLLDDVRTALESTNQLSAKVGTALPEIHASLARLEACVNLQPLQEEIACLRQVVAIPKTPTPVPQQRPWQAWALPVLLGFLGGALVMLALAYAATQSDAHIHTVVQSVITELYKHQQPKGNKK